MLGFLKKMLSGLSSFSRSLARMAVSNLMTTCISLKAMHE